MIIEIHGGQFNNKGALKMLITCKNTLEIQYPNATFVVDKCVGTLEQINSLGLKTLCIKRGWMGSSRFRKGLFIQRMIAFINEWCPPLFKNSITLNKVDALVDVSGFAYTDQWGYRPSQDFAKLSSWYKCKGKKVIMLPQAFGTFQTSKIKAAISKIIDSCDLIYARDSTSYSHLIDINPTKEVIQQAPDLTLFANSTIEDNQAGLNKNVAIIPNMRMLDQGGIFWKSNYIKYLNLIVDLCFQKSLNPIFVIHDQSGEDSQVAEMVLSKRTDIIDQIKTDDPWELKNILSECYFVVGSRFHGLVAAISNGVPVIAIGWSHKYAELLSEFKMEKFLITAEKNGDLVSEDFNSISDPAINMQLRNVIKSEYINQYDKNQKMWNCVFNVLDLIN